MKKLDDFNIKKCIDYSNMKWQEVFFITQIRDMTSIKNTLLNFPDVNCFTYCLKEMISVCDITEEINNKSYFILADSFYDFMKKDHIFKDLDCFQYYNLMKRLKKIVENKNDLNVKETRLFFQNVLKINRKKYIDSLKENIKKLLEGKIVKEIEIYNLTNIFLNELLSMGYSYKYLSEILDYYYFNNTTTNVFLNTLDLVNFLFDYSVDNFDMYLPLKNISKRDIDFVQTKYGDQKIELGKEINLKWDNDSLLDDDIYYCHIYFSMNDYIKGLGENIRRISSIFNVLKFYTHSRVDFDYCKNTYIRSKKLGKINNRSIENFLEYSYFQGTEKIINNINKNFTLLKDKNANVLEEIHDIMNYSQKNSDTLGTDQFVSKWISLEMTANKSYNKKGFDAVLNYVPNYLTITLFRKKLNTIIKKSNCSSSIETFIRDSRKPNFISKLEKIKNPYYKFLIDQYANIFGNNTKFYDEIAKEKKKLEEYIYRIYILRNKYIHSGDTSNYNDILRYALNMIEPFFVDTIIKAANNIIEYNEGKIDKFDWKFVFVELDYKYEIINNTILLTKEKFKISSNDYIDFSDLCIKDEIENVYINIILERHCEMIKCYNYCAVELEDDELNFE